jgi:hypothetical protein
VSLLAKLPRLSEGCVGCPTEGFQFRTRGVRRSKIGQRNPGEGAGVSQIADRLPHESQRHSNPAGANA